MGTLLIRPPGHRRDVALRPAATAMVWVGEGHPHETIAVPGVALGDQDVLVAVEMSTICGSDVHTVQGRRSAPAPLVLGHESVGRVIAMGDDGAEAVDGTPLRIGDRVVWSVTVSCGTCDRCRRGLTQKCRDLGKYGHDRVGAHGDLTGAFASHVQLRAGTAIVRVPEALPAAVLAPAACATADRK
ncbi:alcohol dehydrogenase catalytic domain-containing protein, partial [Microbacterium sp. UBA6633]|uniref:alcohol dehydrogenase catalytic domain-containing protein n=1 Tax=Microbacterium sp. UBA6633 TaxID=1946951 RepID=UPI0025E6773F